MGEKQTIVIDNHAGIDFKKVYDFQSFGNKDTNTGIIILVAQGREFTDTDKMNISDLGDKLKDELFAETIKTSEETKKNNTDNREQITKLFGGQNIFVEEIENGYFPGHSYWRNFFWYKIATKFGYFKVGWRKHVLNIDWTETLIGDSAKELFPHENVTRDGRNIHADNYDKAREYIEVLMNAKFMESLNRELQK